MIPRPRVRGFICTSSHPKGCAANVNRQIGFVNEKGSVDGPKRVLIIGGSMGYGLASRIVSATASGADTLSVYFEKEPTEKKWATAGWYNTKALEKQLQDKGLYAKSVNGDAFSQEIKDQIVDTIKKDWGQVDLVVYSLAAPRKRDSATGEVVESVIKPIGNDYEGLQLDPHKSRLTPMQVGPATEQEIEDTIKVMGGADWQSWIERLQQENLLADGFKTVSFTYIGDQVTWPIYGQGTLGRAKKDLDVVAEKLRGDLTSVKGDARVCVLKALVTQSSAAIPAMPLYIALLYKVMKRKGTHEGCIEQIDRLFRDRLYADNPELDGEGRLRVDELELTADVQSEVAELMGSVTEGNLEELADVAGYRDEFLSLFGFGFDGVDYEEDLDPQVGA